MIMAEYAARGVLESAEANVQTRRRDRSPRISGVRDLLPIDAGQPSRVDLPHRTIGSFQTTCNTLSETTDTAGDIHAAPQGPAVRNPR